MNENLHVDDVGFELIKKWEGVRNHAYQDARGIWTIGIGFIRYTLGEKAGQRVQRGDHLTDEEIRAEFCNQVKIYEDGVRQSVSEYLTQSQFNACVSLCYNIGVAGFAKSSICRNLNQRKYQAACRAFSLYVYAGGKFLKGLENRRKDEMREFFRNG